MGTSWEGMEAAEGGDVRILVRLQELRMQAQ
jgi:hypothetical protein